MYVSAADPRLRDAFQAAWPDVVVDEEWRPLFASHAVVGISDVSDPLLRHAVRHFLANADKPIRLAIVTEKELSSEEAGRLEQNVLGEYRRAHDANQIHLHKIRSLGDGEWKSECEERHTRWRTAPSIQHNVFANGPHMKSEVTSYFAEIRGLEIQPQLDTVHSKPPVLHWPIAPLDGELQIMIRVAFGVAGPDEATLREMSDGVEHIYHKVYRYTDGCLMTSHQPVRVHIQRMSSRVLEIAARIELDELEGEESLKPCRLLWPHLTEATRRVLAAINTHPFMQYTLSLILFGEQFFHPPLENRVFDMAQFATTARAHDKVSFLYKGTLHDVILHEVFPDGIPCSLSDLLDCPPPPAKPAEEHERDSLPAMDFPQQTLAVTHNRGRRVSFGTIRCVADDTTKPVVDEFVDDMLKQTMDQIQIG